MDAICSTNDRANRLSALAQAADCLAKAAATLSEAARAAAETFSSELAILTSDVENIIISDGNEEPPGIVSAMPANNQALATTVDPCSSGPMTIDQLRFDPARPPPASLITDEIETVAGLAYRILVDQEADVLLFVCALIRNRRKVICYMNCSIPTFHMYKKLINDVTKTAVYTITKITTTEITEVGQKFLEAERSILLLPETITPSIEIDDVDSWVVHVGWPADEQRYEDQRLIHQAQNSIIVAYSGDEELHPAGAAIMWQSQAWPGDADSFRASVALLRPIFNQSLALIPAEMKAKVYPDWISCHGSRGHRYVKSWDATTLITNANSFMSDVLKYQALSLPEVSHGFVTHHGLQSAMMEGILLVKSLGSGVNHISSLPKNDWVPSDSTRSEGSGRASTSTPWGVESTPVLAPPISNKQANKKPRINRPDSSGDASVVSTTPARTSQPRFGMAKQHAADFSSRKNAFKPMLGNTYFAVEEEFDAIPLMCFLAEMCGSGSKKVILFLDISGCHFQYQKLIALITQWTVFVADRPETIQSTEDAASRFIKSQGSAVLLLPFKIQTPPSSLGNVHLDHCIYWGSTLDGFVPLAQAKRHSASLRCSSTSIIMTVAQRDKINSILNKSNFRAHPSSADLMHREDSIWLSDSRKATKSILSSDRELVTELYEGHLKTLARTSSGVLGAQEIASRINKFTASVLLSGSVEDGSNKHPPIAPRLVTSVAIVSKYNLQAAVEAGMLIYELEATPSSQIQSSFVCTEQDFTADDIVVITLPPSSTLSDHDTTIMLPIDCQGDQALLLSHATECLAKAATALSEAAEAVAAAAKSLISENDSVLSTPRFHKEMENNNGINAIVDYESDSGSSPTMEPLPMPVNDTNNAHWTQDYGQTIVGPSDQKPSSGRPTTQEIQNHKGPTDIAAQRIVAEERPGSSITTLPHPAMYQSVNTDKNEPDVLLAVCALVHLGGKFICYLRSSVRSLPMYKTILSTAGVPVHIAKSFSSEDLEHTMKSFENEPNSVLLLPARYPQKIMINKTDYQILHVGWPSDELLYKQQINDHQAKNNVLVTYSGDRDVYLSSDGILMDSQPWSQYKILFETTCTTLRPLFNQTLDEISSSVKAKAYRDWIVTHGPHGPYGPPSWSPSMLAHRANRYLLDVLRYNGDNSDTQTGAQVDLPEVSEGLVSSQNLKSAVEEGLLRVKSNSELEHVSPQLKTNILPGQAPVTQSGCSSVPPSLSFEPEEPGSLNIQKPVHIPTRPPSRTISVTESSGNIAPGRKNQLPRSYVTQYLIIEADLDTVPALCHLSTRPGSRNVICFIKCLAAFEPIIKLLEQMVGKPAFYIKGSESQLAENIETALRSAAGCLIFCSMYNERPAGLKNVLIGLTIHLGWIDNLQMYSSQIQQDNNTVIFLRRETQVPNWPEVSASLDRAQVVPVNASTKRLYNRQTENSVLQLGRNTWRDLLTTSAFTPLIRSSYMSWITHHYIGRHKELDWTAVDVVTHANNYFKRVFRSGSSGDAYRDRPLVTAGFIKHLGLEAAVAASRAIGN
ncbi:hypothetical protein RHS02_08670, partial [Rhizoctonia solani]